MKGSGGERKVEREGQGRGVRREKQEEEGRGGGRKKRGKMDGWMDRGGYQEMELLLTIESWTLRRREKEGMLRIKCELRILVKILLLPRVLMSPRWLRP